MVSIARARLGSLPVGRVLRERLRSAARWRPRYSLRTLVVFMLLATSMTAAWLSDPPWQVEAAFKMTLSHPAYFVRFLEGHDRLEIITGDHTKHGWVLSDVDSGEPSGTLSLLAHVYSTSTGLWLASQNVQGRGWPVFLDEWGWLLDDPGIDALQGAALVSPDGSRCLHVAPFITIAWPMTGRLSDGYYPCRIARAEDGKVLQVLEHDFEQRGESGVLTGASCFSADGTKLVTVGTDKWVHVWRRTRPDRWWGVFWLGEFWMTAAFAMLLCWSILGDRRALRAAVDSAPAPS